MSENFSQRLKRLRLEKGLTAAEMARLIGVAPTTYREWEYGRGAKFPPCLKISQVLAVSVTELVSGASGGAVIEIRELAEIEEKLRQVRLKLLAMN